MHLLARGLAAIAILTAGLAASACSPAVRSARSSSPAPATRSASASPSRTPASPAATGVYGNLRIGFIPASPAARPVRPPITVALIIRPVSGGRRTTWATDSDPAVKGFQFSLPFRPGRYQIQALGLRSASLSPTGFRVGRVSRRWRPRAAASLTRPRCNARRPRDNADPQLLQAQRQQAGDVVPSRTSATSLTRCCSGGGPQLCS